MKEYLMPEIIINDFDDECVVLSSSVDALSEWKNTNAGQLVSTNREKLLEVTKIVF